METVPIPKFDLAPQPGTRFHALDVWRGLVCLLVVFEHAGVALWSEVEHVAGFDGWFRRGLVTVLKLNLGSVLFFVMSGFCIASCLASARQRGTSPMVFLFRRLWRIFPPYWAALAVFVVTVVALDAVGLETYHRNGISLELDSPRILSRAQWLGNLTLTETWRPLVGGGEPSIYTRVAWSLCYQEQFYLVCFLAFLAFPLRHGRALAVATVGIVAFHLMVLDIRADRRIAGTFPIHWHEFAVGLVLYWRLGPSASPAERRAVDIGLAAMLVFGLANGSVFTVASALFGLLLVALSPWDRQLPTLRWLDPLRACGRRSYSLYLVHLPVVMLVNVVLRDCGVSGFWPRVLAMVPAAIAASLAVAWAFHSVVEHHFLQLPACPRPEVLGAALSVWDARLPGSAVGPPHWRARRGRRCRLSDRGPSRSCGGGGSYRGRSAFSRSPLHARAAFLEHG